MPGFWRSGVPWLVAIVLVAQALAGALPRGVSAGGGEAGSAGSDWEQTPVAGRVTHLALSGAAVYALAHPTERGTPVLWRGETAGTRWAALPLPAGQVRDLAVHPTDPRLVYVAGEGGVYRSEDGGTTWSLVLAAPGNQHGLRVVVSPAEAALLYATTGLLSSGAIWRSLDAGTTWERLQELQGTTCGWTFPVVAPDPVVRDRVYLSYYCAAGRVLWSDVSVSEDLWATEGRTIFQPSLRGDDPFRSLFPQAVAFEPAGPAGDAGCVHDVQGAL